VVLIAVLYLMLIEPAWTGISRLERSLPQQRSLAAELDALLGEVRGLKSQPQVATVSPSEVSGAIETSLTRAGMKAARIVPLADGDIQLTFANVPYGTWAAWLAGIERELGARTTSVVITGKDATRGNVDAELALRLARK
jgi:general secretion pathway protein M